MKQENLTFNVFASQCPSRAVFEHIFSRWGVLILTHLREGPSRFGEITRSVEGISERMLSKSLKNLEEEGFIYRKDFHQKPPRVEYGLTPSGKKISDLFHQVINQLYEEMKDL